jgi:hypothetical protein
MDELVRNNPQDDLTNENKTDELEVENAVTLSPQQYAALLEKIDELESKTKGRPAYSLEELAEEGKSRPDAERKARPPDKNLDDMNRLELAQYIVNVIGDHFTPIANDLQVQLQTIKVAQEIDRAALKYQDFWDLHEDILRIGTENPSLSIEKAYKLAKAERGERPIDKKSKDQTLLTLPPKPVLGDKPSGPTRKSTAPKVMSLSEAADRAWADVGDQKQT